MRQTFALVIGINKYEWSPNENLQGAVADAKNFRSYLLQERKVPEANITFLRDEQATRSAIIENFRNLERNEKIIPGEAAIIIYFAGHGAVAHKPRTWENWETPNGNVEMLCPADINLPLDKDGKKIEGIPDRTVSRLLLDLSNAKGNNITLILDCCHAAGMNRGGDDPGSRIRSFGDTQDLSPTCDNDIYLRGPQIISDQDRGTAGFSSSFWGSHILLAACGHNQAAREKDKKGIFTTTLLSALRELASGDPPPTYDSLMKGLRMPDNNQTPHLDGKHVHRFIFDSRKDPAGSSMILCYKGSPWPSDLVLYAGSFHGITKGSTFEIFESDWSYPDSKDPRATLKVEEVKKSLSRLLLTPSESVVFNSSNKRQFWYARLRKASEPLHTYCDDSAVLDRICNDSPQSRLTASVIRADKPDDADIYLTVEANIVSFDQGKRVSARSKFSSYFPRYPPLSVHNMPTIREFINRYAHFTSRLIIESPISTADPVTIEMNKLRWDDEETRMFNDGVVLSTVEDVELQKVLTVDTSVHQNDRVPYGFTVCDNGGGSGLYAYLLYFDASTLSIKACYQPQKSQIKEEGSIDACLTSGSTLTLGYGRTAMNPVVFDVPDGQDSDVCFVKIIVATKAVDIGPIEQLERDSPPDDSKLRGALTLQIPPQSDFKWNSKTITIKSNRSKVNGLAEVCLMNSI
ncbi:caspase domain-containing protein [Desarmillaria tabescens]|uniref:Caspase domain-containing protein n=1 Tax=Armillaria tabescens TaxID=1929756 RepID=A0AA39KCP7_ARMTA|nr:caspase domain-containing protein [Desarmillaria tabescens]KAK0457436.1 caspase domain-containing protein [Desarmillaria tabescens]